MLYSPPGNYLRWLDTVFDICISFAFFSKNLDPLVAKKGLFHSLADVCVVAMATSINIKRPLKSVLFISNELG